MCVCKEEERIKYQVTTKEVIVKALVGHVLINKKAFWSGNAVTQKLDMIFVIDSTYQIDFIE